MKFCFGDIVVVEKSLIGVVVKSWGRSARGKEPEHEVYVRMHNGIKRYKESEMQRYMVRHKYLDEQELRWNKNANDGDGGFNITTDEFIESCRSDFEDLEGFEQFKKAANSLSEFMKASLNHENGK